MNPLLKSILSPSFGFAILRVMTPILFASIGVAITTLSGAVNISLEGTMLISAFFGVIVSAFTKSLILGFLAGILAGVALSSVLSYFHLKLKADIILAAIALNLFASGLTVFLLYIFAKDKGTSSSLRSLVFPSIDIPILKDIPIVGEIFSGHNILTYVALLSVLIFYILIFKTPLGLRIRAVGQNPDAASSVGINVNKIKFYALILSGFFGALGGLYLSMGYVSWFARDMTAGRGFIAIAASNLGANLPLGVFLASILFGILNTIAIYLASLQVPSEFIQMIPYIATIITLAIYSIQASRKKRKS
ncbi:MAG TPA: ABC transporter permease [Caldisericia bacterium]|nr:ABC transporter permease [Caldisericia bacterium]HPB33309.1 ABC transporter permease [Caldisericia bacterium]HQL66292.1 ABC transporter permease [Caldisericia bacterium]HQN48818.1 ABC transporter permease [Caldisericia bacterium]HQP00552.1 ABC transporter permease [Caldisericia bacterium]